MGYGGIVGWLSTNMHCTSCYNTGTITGTGKIIGGIAGGTGGTIEKCYNKGTIIQKSVNNNVGGIVGHISPNMTNVKVINNYNRGKIIEEANDSNGIGGIIGNISNTGTSGEIKNNYNVGEIEVTGTNPQSIGGVFGNTSTNFTIDNNYYELNKSNVTLNNVGTGLQQSDMKIQQFVDQLNGGQTDLPWQLDTGINDGYPILNWQQ